MMMRRVPLGLFVLPLLAGCYVNRPLADSRLEPAPGTRLVIELTDAGRAAMAPQVGPDVGRVEGALIQRSDSQYVLGVSKVFGLYGTLQKWEGEQMTFPAPYVRRLFERRFSLGRTLAVAGGMTVGLVVLGVSTSLLGGGGNDAGPGPTPPPGNNN
jgi:hypothetical protein